MSSQTIHDAFVQWEIPYKQKIIQNTWGHLAPKKNKSYTGYIIFCVSVHGDIVPINWEFKSLESSPWFYEALQDFIYENSKEHGVVYRFNGTFKNYEFTGKIVSISTE